MVDFKFQERATISGAINISQSALTKKQNASNSVKFKIGYEGEIAVGSTAEYYDSNDVLLIDGLIKGAKELSKDINSENRIYEITIYDYGYNLIDGNLLEVFRSISPEDLIEDVVLENGLTFNNLLPGASGITIPKKVYKDLNPIEAVNDMCNLLGANWRVIGTEFTLFRRGDFTSSEVIDGNSQWALNQDGWIDDTSKQAKTVIVKGATILQRTEEQIIDTNTIFTLSRTPEDMEVAGLTQTTESIVGDYVVDKEDKKVTFNSSKTDPTFFYSYLSQIRVEVGDGSPIKVLEKKYIEDITEARKLGRKYIEIFGDGIQSSTWLNTDMFNLDLTKFNVGDLINVYNKLNLSRDGKYEITKIVRKYPQKTEITVGEEVLSIFDWQAENKERQKQLEQKDQNDDFLQFDKFQTGKIKVKVSATITKLLVVINTGEILWASDTTQTNDSDLISDTGIDDDFALAYDDDGLPSGSFIDLTP